MRRSPGVPDNEDKSVKDLTMAQKKNELIKINGQGHSVYINTVFSILLSVIIL